MRYIRTKDGIYSDIWWEEHHKELKLREGDFIKLADTIEDLCDWITYQLPFCYYETVFIPSTIVQRNLYSLKEMISRGLKEGAIANVKGMIGIGDDLICKAKLKGILPNGELDWELL